MQDINEGVQHTTSEALRAKDEWEIFMLKIQEAKDKMPVDEKAPTLLGELEKHVQWCIETLKGDIVN